MATDDRQILVTGTAPAPATWLVPGNGQVTPRSIFAHFNGAAAASPFYPALKVISDAGQTVGIYPCEALVAAGGSADVSWFPGAELEEAAQPGTGVTQEQFFLDSSSAGVTSSTVLASGLPYVITVQGTFSIYNAALNEGSPNSDAMFPGAVGGRVSLQVGQDAETCFAKVAGGGGPAIGHQNQFQIDLGGGYAHVEPEGGPFVSPQANYLYRYTVTGQGSTASFRINDTPLNDNYGNLQIVIQGTSGASSGGGGGGSLLPPASVANSLLRAVSGVPTWQAQPSLTESDLSLSNVTTADVSTARHGFAPKAPNDETKFLDGTGAYSVPPGGGTISNITSTASTITVGSPAGPTTNVDLPTTGVGAGTYGDSTHVATVTVDARGRITGASSVAISGSAGAGGLLVLYDSGYLGATGALDTGAGGIASGHFCLIVVAYLRSDAAGVASDNVNVIFNNDSSSLYNVNRIRNTNATLSGASTALAAFLNLGTSPAATSTANVFGAFTMTVPAYDGTSNFKTGTAESSATQSPVASSLHDRHAFSYQSTAAISRLKLSPNAGTGYVAGSRLIVYGAQ